jgi:hypothetical protein
MPRRNNRRRHCRRVVEATEPQRQPTYEQMARDLVARGLASPLILGPTRGPITSQEGTTA